MIFIGIYLAAIIAANLSVAYFGPPSVIINAFLFIGLDLTTRDHLHRAWKDNRLLLKMTMLIGAGSALSWAFNANAGSIAIASFVAFASAAMVDAFVYHQLFNAPRWLRINGSNVPAAMVDSVVFSALAFGVLMPAIVAGQFMAKVAGGFAWSLVLKLRLGGDA